MAVVRAEHHHVRTLGNQRTEQFIVLGGTALTDNDLHAGIDARTALVQRGAFMIGSDACCCILVTFLPRQSGSMAIDRLAVTQGCLDFSQRVLVARQDARVVHHLAQETNVLASHQCFCILNVNDLAASLYVSAYCRHTTGGTEAEVEDGLFA